MATFQVAAANVQPGAVRTRPAAGVDPAATVTAASVQLADPNGVWDTTPGNVLRWGVQASRANGTFANDGTDWQNQGSVYQDNLAFGSRDRSGGLPSLRMAATDQAGNPLPIAPPGVRLRLAIQVDAAIVLGAEIRTNADAG